MKIIIDIPEETYTAICDNGYIFDEDSEDVAKAIRLAIKVLEESPQGEWKHNNFDEHYCSKCRSFALWSEEADDYYEVRSNFCPNCGADMRGEE